MNKHFLFFLGSSIFLGIVGYLAIGREKNHSSTNPFPEVLNIPLGLIPIQWPQDNPYSKEKAELGRLLYFDPRLSSNGTVSCASCHSIACGYADCKTIAVGIDNEQGSRHSPTVINAVYSRFLFWDGRVSSLEAQCIGPLGNTKEMTTIKDIHEAHLECARRIKDISGYAPLFRQAFGHSDVTIDEIAKAIATFERTILSGNSPYDRYKGGDKQAMSSEAIHGMELFKEVQCANCHSGFNFSNNWFQNIGIGMDSENPDLGRFNVTQDPKDWGAFKSPPLREVAHTAPYMHDGSLKTLEEVIEYYDRGGIKNKNLHPLIRPLNLSSQDKKDLVTFLESLSGEGWQHFQEPENFPN